MGEFLSLIEACARQRPGETSTEEEITLPFPKTDQYSDVNGEIQYLFNHYISSHRLQFNQGLFRIDGNLNTDEEPLFLASLEILDSIIDRVPPQKMMQDYNWTEERVLKFTRGSKNAVDSLIYFSLEVTEHDSEQISRRTSGIFEMPEESRKFFVSLSESFMIYARPDERAVLSYCLAEAEEAARQNHPLSFSLLEGFSNLDLSDENGFREFLLSRAPWIAEAIGQFNGNIVDFIDSGSRENPTLVVFLDLHKDAELNMSNLHDAAALIHLDPVVGLEGHHFNELPNSDPDIKKRFWEVVQKSRDLARESKDHMALETGAEFERYSDSFEYYSKNADKVLQYWKLMMAIDDMELSFSEKEKILWDSALTLAGMNEQVSIFQTGPRLLYPKMDARGYEYHGYEEYKEDLEDKVSEDQVEPYLPSLLDGLNPILRSRAGLDNMLEMMAQKGVPLGAMPMGAGHYLSLKDYARERGGVNVIFVQPLPYTGNLPH